MYSQSDTLHMYKASANYHLSKSGTIFRFLSEHVLIVQCIYNAYYISSVIKRAAHMYISSTLYVMTNEVLCIKC